MQNLVVLSACLVISCFASPIVQQAKAVKQEAVSEQASNSYGSAFDIAYSASKATFQCFKQMSYNVAFIRAYNGEFQGQIDPYATTNIQNAAAAGLGTEVFMTPSPTSSSKSGLQQFDEMYNMLTGANIFSDISMGSVLDMDHSKEDMLQKSVFQPLNRYWKTDGSGEADESPANFKDFKEFGSWTTPTVKQYGQFETICGVIVNR
ncbi:hypothetical protein TELCIR_13760 [Teladorsagia circumcincta]|uniref:Uncharacterized protein n=1 Tax=Teladorsagia circumcincta TaxID=45464 RepID=A0A2G9U2Y1_TELCI|nr:hypothetical protein TELCIR_13760 [Teladorsagia circumcincta]